MCREGGRKRFDEEDERMMSASSSPFPFHFHFLLPFRRLHQGSDGQSRAHFAWISKTGSISLTNTYIMDGHYEWDGHCFFSFPIQKSIPFTILVLSLIWVQLIFALSIPSQSILRSVVSCHLFHSHPVSSHAFHPFHPLPLLIIFLPLNNNCYSSPFDAGTRIVSASLSHLDIFVHHPLHQFHHLHHPDPVLPVLMDTSFTVSTKISSSVHTTSSVIYLPSA